MASPDYEQIFRERGYELVTSELLAPVQLPGAASGVRTALCTGRRQSGSHTLEVQLQEQTSSGAKSLAVVARVRGAQVHGDGSLAPHGVLRSGFKSMFSGPRVSVVVMSALMAAGLVAVVVPAMFLVALIVTGTRGNAGYRRFVELTAPEAQTTRVWGRQLGAARMAMPHALQEALARTPRWFGFCEVRGGELTLDRQLGHGRSDLMRSAFDAVEAASAVLP
ncbi:MAG: hypothetical protein JNK82_23070 [Myxococcaceae bacterium]|nr:hypothetical protein [Myxococcaceae bacterium]